MKVSVKRESTFFIRCAVCEGVIARLCAESKESECISKGEEELA